MSRRLANAPLAWRILPLTALVSLDPVFFFPARFVHATLPPGIGSKAFPHASMFAAAPYPSPSDSAIGRRRTQRLTPSIGDLDGARSTLPDTVGVGARTIAGDDLDTCAITQPGGDGGCRAAAKPALIASRCKLDGVELARGDCHVKWWGFGEGNARPAALFHYSPDRTAAHPLRHLAGWRGILQADAYAGFNGLYDAARQPGPVTEAGCSAHARRKFFELAELGKAPLAVDAVQRIDAIFTAERELNGQS